MGCTGVAKVSADVAEHHREVGVLPALPWPVSLPVTAFTHHFSCSIHDFGTPRFCFCMEQLSREILLAQGEVYIKRETPCEADDKTKRRFLPSFAGKRYSRMSLVVRMGGRRRGPKPPARLWMGSGC